MTGPRNESEILEIYSRYKQSRDVIDETTYFSLLRSARNLGDSQKRESEMAEIMQIARSSGQFEMERQSGTPLKAPSGQSVWLNLKFRFADFISASQFTNSALAGGFALLLALVLWLPQSSEKFDSGADYTAQVLIDNADQIAQLVAANQDWQYGFASSGRPSSMAFQAGELVVDLRHLCRHSESCSSDTLAKRLAVHLPYAESANELDLWSPGMVAEVELTLSEFYSEQLYDPQMFRFGQWLEYHYLLAELSLANGQTEVFISNYQQQTDLIEWFEQLALNSGILESNEVPTFRIASTRDISLQSLRRFSTLLIKIRSLLLYG